MKQESLEKLKSEIVSTYRNFGDTKLYTNNKSYTGNQLADEIENETDFGVDLINNIIQLTIDLLNRGTMMPYKINMKKEDILDIINNGDDEAMEFLRAKSKEDPEVYKILQEIREEDKKNPDYKPSTIDSTLDIICRTFYLSMSLNKTDSEKLSIIETFLNILIKYDKKDDKAKSIISEFLEKYTLKSNNIYKSVEEKYTTLYGN